MANTAQLSADLGAHVFVVRRQNVMLDADLAALYGVETKRLNEQVRRNITRFPDAFMFQLSDEETAALRSQFATSKSPPKRSIGFTADVSSKPRSKES